MVRTGQWRILKIIAGLAFLVGVEFLPSCKKEDIQPLHLVSVTAGTIDLTGTATGVPVSVPIKITFTTALDPLSVSDSTVHLTRDYDHVHVPLTLIISGSLLSIRSTANLISGAYYTLVLSEGIQSTHGDPFGPLTITFKTTGVFVPENQVAYWSFENSLADLAGAYDPVDGDIVAMTYAPSKNDSSGTAALFDGSKSLVQIAKGSALLTPEFAISFWMKLDSKDHTAGNSKQKGSFVLGIANTHGLQFEVDPDYAWCRFSNGLLLADGTTVTNDFLFVADGVTKDNVQNNPDTLVARGIGNATVLNQNFGAAGLRQRLDKVWAHVAMTFDDSTKSRSLFINGEKMYQQNFELLANTAIPVMAALRPLATVSSLAYVPDSVIPAHYDDKLVFGFWQSRESTFGADSATYVNPDANHFKGLLDDVRIFNRALTSTEISLIYEGEKPD